MQLDWSGIDRPRQSPSDVRSMNVTESKAYPVPRPWSSSLAASPAPPGPCTPTKPNSIPRGSRTPWH